MPCLSGCAQICFTKSYDPRKSQIFGFLTVFETSLTFLKNYPPTSEILGLAGKLFVRSSLYTNLRPIFLTQSCDPRKSQFFDFFGRFSNVFDFSKTTASNLRLWA